jgi:3-hydroxyanthranilate 3,4-dioxygenase
MVLKVMEKAQPKDIPIKEGEMFVLPGHIPHSPQVPSRSIRLLRPGDVF